MIEIHPLREKDKLAILYKSAEVIMTENSMAVVMCDGDEVLGNCLFDLCDDFLIVNHIEPKDDAMMADGILRSALHVGVQNGKMKAFYSEKAPFDLINKLGFVKNKDNKEINVEKLFGSCCKSC